MIDLGLFVEPQLIHKVDCGHRQAVLAPDIVYDIEHVKIYFVACREVLFVLIDFVVYCLKASVVGAN